MTNIILTYRLKAGTTAADFETWVKGTDHPAMRGLKRVKRFETYKVTGLLMGDGAPSAQYIEVFEIDDFAGFTGEDMAGGVVQGIMGAFMGMVDAPEFMIAEAIDPT